MNEELEVLKDICQRLENARMAYMITGSIAANVYTIPRMTRDIDIVVEIGPTGADQLYVLFQNDFYVDKLSIVDAIKKEGMFNIIHNIYVIKIDFVIRKDSAYRRKEFSRRREYDIEGVKVWVVSPEDLIISKLFWAKDSFSELQIRDVKNLLESIKNLDMPYIEQWIGTLGLNQVYGKVKNG